MEESADENISTDKHHDALQAMEKPFYDILGKAYPSSPKQTVINSGSQSDFPDDINNNYNDLECSGSAACCVPWGTNEVLLSSEVSDKTQTLAERCVLCEVE